MADTTLSTLEQNAILQEIGTILPSAILDEWVELQFVYAGVVEISTMSMTVVRPDGSAQPINPPRRAARLMRELRTGMFQPAKGAWFTARYVLEPSGRHHVEFDYDNEPEFDFSLASGSYSTDLRQFPREEEHIPPWLRLRLEAAGEA